MISHFWNLCRACPALDVDKLHSEYRSTYKWHEFTPKQGQDVVRNPPLSSNADFPFMRKKKHPDVAYKSHEFFDMSLAPGYPHRSSGSDAVDSRTEYGSGSRRLRGEGSSAQRRAQSEGPGIRNPLFRDDGNDIRPAAYVTRGGSNPVRATDNVPVHNRRERSVPNKDAQEAMHSSFPPPTSAGEGVEKESKKTNKQNGSRQAQMKESLSMGHILPATVPKSDSNNGGLDTAAKAVSSGVVNNENGSEPVIATRRRREYSSEYRKSFRPFSQYEYVDGRFVPSVGFQAKPSAIAAASANKAASLHGEPWYQEVVELRRQAQDYKCRGWGTEAMSSPHSTSHYYKQIELYEQASRRESLSALSLAISTPRPTSAVSKDDKGERISPAKSASHYRPSRPRTAPPPVRGSSAKSSRSESAHPLSETAAASSGVRPPSVGPRGSRDHVDSSRAQASKAPARARSPTKRVSRPPSASTASSSVAPSPAPEPEMNGAAATGKQPAAKAQQQLASKRQRPIERDGSAKTASSSASAGVPEAAAPATATSSVVSCHGSSSTAPRRPFSRSSSKTGGGGVGVSGSRDTSRPPSAFENNIDYFREPVVKSPPEPTRVKSPEGIIGIRSPDPINWTVPLDTAKTFSVTQSVRDGDSARNSPMSDHSSLFDSVSGTAINLGRGAYHHPQRISSLAKEAILQPGLIKDSTMTRPGVSAVVDPSKPLATEAHPNPSIPEAVEETPAKDEPIPDVMTTSVYQPNGNGSAHVNGDEAKQVPGTKLKCLEDPSFEFESAPAAKETPKKPSYRVLEDPFEADKSFGQKASNAKVGPYKVLEDPMCTSVYEAGPSAGMTSTRPMASEVLEGARERFDKFWGGKSKESGSGES